jgi:uncharacterized protein
MFVQPTIGRRQDDAMRAELVGTMEATPRGPAPVRQEEPPDMSHARPHARSFALPLAIVVALVAAASVGAAQRTLTVGGSYEGSSIAAATVTVLEVLAAPWLDVRVLVGDSAGSTQSLEWMLAGELDMAVVFGGDAYLAHLGLPDFDSDDDPVEGVRAVGFLFPVVAHLMTAQGSTIHRPGDLAGKRVAVGPPGSGGDAAFERFARQLGIVGDVFMVYVGGERAIELLRAGRVDAYHTLAALPSPVVAAASADGGLRAVSTREEARASGLFERFPFYGEASIDAGAYVGNADAAVETWGDAGVLVVRAGLAADVVYAIATALYGATSGSPGAWPLDLDDALRGVRVPLHEGAARYWRERGVDIPDAALPAPR